MSKEDVINYVMTTPGNPNKAVLEGMLEDTSGTNVPTPTVEDAGKVLGVGDNGKYVLEKKGFTCTEEMITLTEESVTTTESDGVVQGTLSYSDLISADSIRVTFNGVEYTCQNQSPAEADAMYGGFNVETGEFDWSQYPFALNSFTDRGGSIENMIVTETAGTYSIKIEAVEETIETTTCFEKAVRKVADTGFACAEVMTVLTDESVTTEVGAGAIMASGTLDYPELIDYDTIKVTFDGVEYACQNEANAENRGLYGDISGDFAEYPFMLESRSDIDIATGAFTIDNTLYTETAGTHDITIEANALTVTETTKCFAKAVNQVVEVPEVDTSRMSSIAFRAPVSDGTDPETGSTTITVGLGAPTVGAIYNDISKNWVARYVDYLMPLVISTPTKAVFSASTFETVNGATVLRHREIRYTSSGATLTVQDIQIP